MQQTNGSMPLHLSKFRVVMMGFHLCLVIGSGMATAMPMYTIMELATPGPQSAATDINEKGQVVGYFGGPGDTRTYVYTPGRGVVDLGTFGAGRSYGTAISNSGYVTGTFGAKYGPDSRGFLYTPEGEVVDLGSLTGGSTYPTKVNDRGQVTGRSQVNSYYGNATAFLYTPGSGIVSVPSLIGASSTNGMAINNSGQVVGTINAAGGDHVFVYSAAGGAQDIGTFGARSAAGTGINDRGQILSFTSNGQSIVYTPDVGVTSVVDDFRGIDINNRGVVLGNMWTSSARPAVYSIEDGVVDLNSLIINSAGWGLGGVAAINDYGSIVGHGYFNNRYTSFLLTPVSVPEPASTLLMLLAAGAMAVVSRRRRRPQSR